MENEFKKDSSKTFGQNKLFIFVFNKHQVIENEYNF